MDKGKQISTFAKVRVASLITVVPTSEAGFACTEYILQKTANKIWELVPGDLCFQSREALEGSTIKSNDVPDLCHSPIKQLLDLRKLSYATESHCSLSFVESSQIEFL